MNVSGLSHCARPLAITVVLASIAGCSSKATSVSVPGVDASTAAAKAIELYDANKDGKLSKDEVDKCPPLSAAMSSLDANNDGILAADEIEKQLQSLCGTGSAFISYSCVVTLGGRPLAGATVKLRPAEFLGDAVPSAEGTTDPSGMARPTISQNKLPPQLAKESLVFPGLYHVEITNQQPPVPARYNTATELGCEVNPSSRTGTSARFDLKSN